MQFSDLIQEAQLFREAQRVTSVYWPHSLIQRNKALLSALSYAAITIGAIHVSTIALPFKLVAFCHALGCT